MRVCFGTLLPFLFSFFGKAEELAVCEERWCLQTDVQQCWLKNQVDSVWEQGVGGLAWLHGSLGHDKLADTIIQFVALL